MSFQIYQKEVATSRTVFFIHSFYFEIRIHDYWKQVNGSFEQLEDSYIKAMSSYGIARSGGGAGN